MRGSNPSMKSMASYESAAWDDARSIAAFINENFDDLPRAREMYEKTDLERVKAFEAKTSDFIADFLGKTEGQRQAYFNRVTKNIDEKSRLLFLTLCLLAAIRVRDLIEIRDQYRQYLVPGCGYRATTKALYEFDRECRKLANYDWPSEPFDAIGLDDGAWEDDANDGEWLETSPAPEAPPVPVQPEPNYREIVVQHVQSKRFTLDPAGRITPIVSSEQQGLWRFVGEDLVACNVLVGSLDVRKIDDSGIRRAGKAFLDYSVPERTTILVANKSLQTILAGDQDISNRVLLAKAGVAQSAFVQWFDDLLNDLLLEMSILGELPPTIAEFLSAIPVEGGLQLMRHAEMDENDATARRSQIARMAIQICGNRGRDLSHYLPALSASPRTPLDRVERGKKLTQTLRKLHLARDQETLTEYGQLSLDVLNAVDEWLRRELTTGAALDLIGDRLTQFIAGLSNPGSHYGLTSMFDEEIGRGTPSCDLILAAVFRRISKPIPAEWMWPRGQPNFGYSVRPPVGFCMAYWIDATIRERSQAGVLRSLPYHHGIAKALGGITPDVGFGVGRDFYAEKSTYRADNGSWIVDGWRWASQLSALVEAFRREESPRPRSALHAEGLEPGRFRILLTARSNSEAPLLSLPQLERFICRTIEDELHKGLAKAGLRDKVDVSDTLIRYSDPFVPHNSRLAKIVAC